MGKCNYSSQSLRVLSEEPERMDRPSREKAQLRTQPVCPIKLRISLPVSISQSLRVLSSEQVSEETKTELTKLYNSLNPAELKRIIDKKQSLLYVVYEKRKNKINQQPINQIQIFNKKLKPFMVRNYIAQPKAVSVR